MAFIKSLLVIFLAILTGIALPAAYAFADISYIQELQIWLVTNKALLAFISEIFSGYMAEHAMYWLVNLVTCLIFSLVFGCLLGLLIGFLNSGRLFFYSCLWYPLFLFSAWFFPELQQLELLGHGLASPVVAIGKDWPGILVMLFVLFMLFFALFRGFSCSEKASEGEFDRHFN